MAYADTGEEPVYGLYGVVYEYDGLVPVKQAPVFESFSIAIIMLNSNNMKAYPDSELYELETDSWVMNSYSGLGVGLSTHVLETLADKEALSVEERDRIVNAINFIGDAERGLTISIWWAAGGSEALPFNAGVQTLFSMSSIVSEEPLLIRTFRLNFQEWTPYDWTGRTTAVLRAEVIQCCNVTTADSGGGYFAEERVADYADSSTGPATRERSTTDMFGEAESDKPNGGRFPELVWQNTILVFTGDGVLSDLYWNGKQQRKVSFAAVARPSLPDACVCRLLLACSTVSKPSCLSTPTSPSRRFRRSPLR